jgi:hypothetical protein
MNSLQYGLQTGHVISEMALQNNANYFEWASKHKTIIICDAINLAGLFRVQKLLIDFTSMIGSLSKVFYPVESFNEDEASLGGIMTCVGAVIPEDIYDFPLHYPESKYLNLLETLSPRKLVENYEFAIENFHAQEFGVERIKFLTYCLLKSYNLAPR